jgi:hypothetical protein
MCSLSTRALLDAWHHGATEPTHQRPLTLLAAACPETPMEKLASMSIGRRDAKLLALREHVFGPDLSSVTTCSGCGERLELDFSVSDIQVEADTDPADTLSLEFDGYNVEFRLPNSLDLSAITDPSDEGAAHRMLLDLCVTRITRNEKEMRIEMLTSQIIDAITTRMAKADPQADVWLKLVCPACGNEWLEAFDIVSYFWTEIEAWVRRVLREVHTLASAYGWRETDILEMNPWRRQYYLNLIQA